MATNGLVVMTPTSIAYSGTSASINADGSVSFSAVSSLSLNGVFTSDYDNYMVTIRSKTITNTGQAVLVRFRASGTDNTTTNAYVTQYIFGTSTSVLGLRTTADYGFIIANENTYQNGASAFFFGPHLAQPTAWRSIGSYATSGASVLDYAGTHNQSTAYDGFTLIANSGAGGLFGGLLTVFAYNQ